MYAFIRQDVVGERKGGVRRATRICLEKCMRGYCPFLLGKTM